MTRAIQPPHRDAPRRAEESGSGCLKRREGSADKLNLETSCQMLQEAPRVPGTGLPLVGQCSLEPSNVRLETECEESLPSGVGCRGPAPAGSRDTLRMMASAREKELKVKGRERGLIFLGLHRKPIKLLTRNLLCSQSLQEPSQWGEDASPVKTQGAFPNGS